MDDPGDRDAITALLHEYARRLDAGDLDGVATLFAHATVWSSRNPTPRRGTAAVRRMYDGVHLYDGRPSTQHVITNALVTIGDDRRSAASQSYFTVLQVRPDFPLQPILAGRYQDRFERAGDAWRFTERVIHPDLVGDLSRHMKESLP